VIYAHSRTAVQKDCHVKLDRVAIPEQEATATAIWNSQIPSNPQEESKLYVSKVCSVSSVGM
jgi:hypothetical protein